MTTRKMRISLVLIGALLAGIALAELSTQFAIQIPGRTSGQMLNRFQNQPPGTIVSIIDGSSGNYINWTKTASGWTEGEHGYSPEHDPNSGDGGSGGDPGAPGGSGNGGSSGPSGPSGGCYGNCGGTVEVGPITKADP